MQRTRRAASLALAASAAMVASMALHSPAAAAPGGPDPSTPGTGTPGTGPGSDVRPVPPDLNDGKEQPLRRGLQRFATPDQAGPAQVGDTKTWLAEDDAKGQIYTKTYTLRGIGDHIEVWVADDRAFPGEDCRNALGLTDITDDQVAGFIDEFDDNIYPTESQAFSIAPDRDGSKATLPGLVGLPDDYYQVDASRADDTVVLVDNVRDANYYDPSTPDGQTYIAGFFYSVFNEYTDRNIMTIDAYDWLHRTGANPPDDSDDPAYQACAAASGAPRPHLYEGTFAHEYQHLLEYYQDPDEVSWVNEGLSDYAQSLVGYVDTSVPVTDPAADSHIACFSGFLADQGYGGPENSLTRWGDQGAPEILCDYGAAYSFMQYLYGHFGEEFLSALHREPANGLDGLQDVLAASGSSLSAMDVVHRWAATMALDNVLSGPGLFIGGDRSDYTEKTLGAQIDWDAAYGDINHDGTADDPGNEAYSTPGAPPNGSDYVRLQDGHGRSAGLKGLRHLTFSAPGTLTPDPVEWAVAATPPDSTTAEMACGSVPAGAADAALYSGCGANLDRSIVRTVQVPEADPTLSFRALWDTEQGWDFGFVQVWDADQGRYVSLSCTDTTDGADPGAIAAVQDNLPGFTGESGGWRDETCDLAKYAGQSVELAFRYVTDPAVDLGGFWVDDVAVGGTTVSDGSSLDGWQSATQAHPTAVHGFTVQLIAYTPHGFVAGLYRLPVRRGADGDFHGRLGRAIGQHIRTDLRHRLKQARSDGVRGASAIGRMMHRATVAAIVMQDDPGETVGKYARYSLRADGVLQPGG